MKKRIIICGFLAALSATSAFAGLTISNLGSPTSLATSLRGVIGNNFALGSPASFAAGGLTWDISSPGPSFGLSGISLAVESIYAEAGYTNELFVDLNSTPGGGTSLFDNMPNPGSLSDEKLISGLASDTAYFYFETTSKVSAPETISGAYNADHVLVYKARTSEKYLFFFDDAPGTDDDNHDDLVALAQVVPEPSSLLFALTTGVFGLFFLRRRK